MNSARVTMQQKDGSYFRITVDVIVIVASETRVQVQGPSTLWQITVFKYPDLPKTAVEAACYSGAFYALRKIDAVYPVDHGHVVVVTQASGTVYDNTAPWAAATFVGICYLTNHPELVTDYELGGWDLVECTISYPLLENSRQ